MKVDLIALDLDDTLLRGDLTISEANKRALAEAEEAGIRIVLASGRNIYSMRRYADELGLDGPGDYLVCSNGAEIIRAATGELVEELRLPPEFCARAARAIEAEGFPWQIYEGGLILVNEPNDWAYEDSRLTGQSAILIEDEGELFSRGLLKFVVPGEPERISPLLARLREAFGTEANVLTSKPCFLEVLPPDADKGAALGRLAARLGIPMSRVMAIGDAMNDLGMIRAAGFGCAPSNAIPEVLRAARYTSELSNEEDAVADLVRRIALLR
jgi:Cof subfamily protein (haloacid dehalogenase superfamily)